MMGRGGGTCKGAVGAATEEEGVTGMAEEEGVTGMAGLGAAVTLEVRGGGPTTAYTRATRV